MEPLRHINNPKFGAVIFRKNATQVFAEGGLFDTAMTLYPQIGGVPRKTPKPMFIFPSGAKVSFGHLEYEKDLLSWQGTQIPLIMFDELTHFSMSQFFYMLSRNRSTSGVSGYVRATCNPDSESWVAQFIQWWWNPDTGYAIPERSGVQRYMVRRDNEISWASNREELWERFELRTKEERGEVKSVTFIASTLQDNQILMKQDPGYLANLKALPTLERERLLYGNWKIKAAAGLFFKREQVTMIETLPDDITRWCRCWDLAATDEAEGGDPAFTAGVLMGKRKNGKYVIADVINRRLKAAGVRDLIKNTAIADKARFKRVKVRLPQDPGQAGKDQAESFIKLLSGFNVVVERESGNKESRAEPLAAQWQAGNVEVLIGDWNESYLAQMEAFPEAKFKDMVDASANGFNELEKQNVSAPPPKENNLAMSSYWLK